MKLSLITLLFCLVTVAGAQELWKPSYCFQAIDDSTVNKVLTVIGKDSIETTSPFGAVAIHSLLALYSRYEKECCDKREVVSGGKYAGIWNGKRIYTDTLWQKVPLSLPGFIEWLRRQK